GTCRSRRHCPVHDGGDARGGHRLLSPARRRRGPEADKLDEQGQRPGLFRRRRRGRARPAHAGHRHSHGRRRHGRPAGLDERPVRPAAALAASALVAACATADGPLPPSTTEGYLEAGALQAIVARMEAPPPSPTAWAGDPAVAPGSDRWWLATAHAEVRAP